MRRNLKLLGILAFVVVFGGLVVLATSLHGAAAVVVWVIWLLGLVATFFLVAGRKASLPLNEATKQVFAQWQAAHPDRNWGWVEQEIPDPNQRISRQDRALIGRITTDPPVIQNGRYDRMTFLGKAEVDGHDVLVMSRGWYNPRTGTVQNRITAVSMDTPGMIRPVCVYRRSGFQVPFGRFTTGDAAFDARFRVDADNRPAARRLLSPDITQFLCQDPRAELVGFTFQNSALSVWLTDRFDDATAIPPMIDLMMALYNRIPAQVWTGMA